MELDRKAVGQKLREARESVGLKPAELAERVGVSAVHINRLENGVRGYTFELMLVLSGPLDLDLNAFRTFLRNVDACTAAA